MNSTRIGTNPLIATQPEQQPRVLVVDGDIGTAEAVTAVLRHAGYDVASAAGASQAVSLLHATGDDRYDILLAGLEVDPALGDQVVHLARERCADVSIILLAGYADLELALGALRTGIDAYLMKPVDADELRTVVERALERQRLRRALVAAHSREHALEARLRQRGLDAREDLERRVQELEQANKDLRDAQEQHERFVAMVAHEMRGPLNPIISYAQLATRVDLPREKLESYMEMVVEHAFRLNRLIDDLRTATRLSTGQFSLQRDWVDLSGAVTEVVEQFMSSVRDRRFSLERSGDPIMAYVDRDRIVQAIRNLVDNAVKYSAEQGAIEVRVWSEGERACISVADYGAGLTDEEMRLIFEAFARGNRGREVAGSGLGLYITRGIAEAHGGHLTVRNRAGDQRAQGAVFTITMPIDQRDRMPE